MGDNGIVIDHVLGVVLAGGDSRRFGSDKADASWIDGTLLERAVETLGEVFDDVAIAGPGVMAGIPNLRDPVADSGPVAGLVAAFDAAAGRPVFVLAVDLPLVTPDTVSLLCRPMVRPYQVRVARAGHVVQPLLGLYGADVGDIARVRLAAGRRSVLGILDDVRVLSIVDVDPRALTNVNRPSDLVAARRLGAPPNTR